MANRPGKLKAVENKTLKKSVKSTPDAQIKGFSSRDSVELKRVTIEFGHRLLAVRIKNALTQKEMAVSLSLNPMTYSRYENGDRIPDADICAQVVSLYGVDPTWLLFGDKSTKVGFKRVQTEKIATNYATIPVYEMADAKHINKLTTGISKETTVVPKSMLHKSTVAITYRESNMSPYIMPGAIVGLNTSLEETPMGYVYAVWVPNSGTRLFKAYSKSLTEITLRSDNPSTPDITVDQKEFKTAVLGRLEWLFQAY